MLRILILAAVLTAVGCKSTKKWIDTRATQIHVAGLEANIPAGWRDFNELVEKPGIKLPEGARMLLLDSATTSATVVVGPEARPVSPDQCDETAVAMRPQLPADASITDVKRALFRGVNPGCLMYLHSGPMAGNVAIMTAANGRTVTIACLSNGSYSEVENACYEVIYGLHPVP